MPETSISSYVWYQTERIIQSPYSLSSKQDDAFANAVFIRGLNDKPTFNQGAQQ